MRRIYKKNVAFRFKDQVVAYAQYKILNHSLFNPLFPVGESYQIYFHTRNEMFEAHALTRERTMHRPRPVPPCLHRDDIMESDA